MSGDILDACNLCANVSGVYQIACSKTGLVYIGRSENIGNRVMGHIYILRKNTHYNRRFQEDFNTYGEDSFIFSILEEAPASELLKIENDLILSIGRAGLYNKHMSGSTGAFANTISEETRKKLSLRQVGSKNHFYGKKHSPETLEKMKKAQDDRKRKRANP